MIRPAAAGALCCWSEHARAMPSSPLAQFVRKPSGRPAEAVLPASELGRALTVKGQLETEGELRIYGNVQGRIDADRLVVAVGGAIEGDVVARDVRIGGRLNGRVFALNVTIDDGADVNGRIFHNTVTVAKGARFEGRMPWRPINYFEALDQLPETRP
jgi:cytoskeletal protein CcmA (bactofilin family)